MKIELPSVLFNTGIKSKVVVRLENQVRKGVSARRSVDIERATTLAVYWYVLGFKENAITILELLHKKVEYNENNRGRWAEYGRTLLLFAHLKNHGEDRVEILSPLLDNDVIEGTRIEYYEEHLAEDHSVALSVAELETQKNQCEIYAGEILHFLYFKYMMEFEDKVYSNKIMGAVDAKMAKVSGYLLEALEKRRVTKKDRLDRHPQD